MIDYEDLILTQQEARDLAEDADEYDDDCSSCENVNKCRKAADGQADWPVCPYQG